MTRTVAAKPLKHFCACGRGFTTRSGDLNHGRVCPVERARSAAFVNALEDGGDPHAAGRAAVREVLAALEGHRMTEPCPLGWRDARCGRFGPCGCQPVSERALALCREFPQTCAGSGGMGGDGGPCGAHLEVATVVDPAVLPEFIDQVRDDLRRLQ